MLSYKQIEERLDNMLGWIEDNTHSDRYTSYIAVDVKRYNDYIDIEDFIEEKVKDSLYQAELGEYLTGIFTEECINDIYTSWLEYESEYLHGGYFENFYTKKDIRRLEVCRQFGIKTGWGIDSYSDKAFKAFKNQQLKASRHVEIIKYLNPPGRKGRKQILLGHIGRSGGWIAVTESHKLQSSIEELRDNITDPYYRHDCGCTLADWYEEYKSVKEDFESVKYISEEVDKFNKGLDFKCELDFRIDQDIEEFNRTKELDFEIAV